MNIRAVLCALVLATAPAHAFEIESADAHNGGSVSNAQVANVFGCDGLNLSPEIAWHDIPEGTQSFVVTVFDRDAPTGSGFWHWVVFDIPAASTGLAAGSGAPDGKHLTAGAVQTRNDAGTSGYIGACPPLGSTHRYVITVKAVRVKTLGLDATASGALVGFLSNANKISEATITTILSR